MVNIANLPKPRIGHWTTLLNARAIENHSFMIDVNRIGFDGNGLEYEESTFIFSPTGEKIESCEIFQDVKIFDLDLEHALEYRKNFPIKNDRKNNIYKEFYS